MDNKKIYFIVLILIITIVSYYLYQNRKERIWEFCFDKMLNKSSEITFDPISDEAFQYIDSCEKENRFNLNFH